MASRITRKSFTKITVGVVGMTGWGLLIQMASGGLLKRPDNTSIHLNLPQSGNGGNSATVAGVQGTFPWLLSLPIKMKAGLTGMTGLESQKTKNNSQPSCHNNMAAKVMTRLSLSPIAY